MRWLSRWRAGPPGEGGNCWREVPPESPGRLVRAFGAVCYGIALLIFALCLAVMLACLLSVVVGLFHN